MVKKSGIVIVWNKSAYASLQKAYDFINRDSRTNAEKVREGILK
ncbi:hypothetical protein [Membranihabitans maritimus]|nr:hypothetical protein [Membranihabitans maritimus]